MEYDVDDEVTEWMQTVDGYRETYECAVEEMKLSMDARVTHRDEYQVALTASGAGTTAVYMEEYNGFPNDLAFHQFYQELTQDLAEQLDTPRFSAESIFGRW